MSFFGREGGREREVITLSVAAATRPAARMRASWDFENWAAFDLDAATSWAVEAATAFDAAIKAASSTLPLTTSLAADVSCWVANTTYLAAEISPSDQAGSLYYLIRS